MSRSERPRACPASRRDADAVRVHAPPVPCSRRGSHSRLDRPRRDGACRWPATWRAQPATASSGSTSTATGWRRLGRQGSKEPASAVEAAAGADAAITDGAHGARRPRTGPARLAASGSTGPRLDEHGRARARRRGRPAHTPAASTHRGRAGERWRARRGGGDARDHAPRARARRWRASRPLLDVLGRRDLRARQRARARARRRRSRTR